MKKSILLFLCFLPLVTLFASTDTLFYLPLNGDYGDHSSNNCSTSLRYNGIYQAENRHGETNKAGNFAEGAVVVETATGAIDGNTEMTVCFWFNPHNVDDNNPTLSKMLSCAYFNSASTRYTYAILYNPSTNQINCQAFYDISIGVQGSVDLPINSNGPTSSPGWHHFAMTITALDSVRVYIDGVKVRSKEFPHDFSDDTYIYDFGGRESTIGTTRYYYGDMDEILVMERALSNEEVLAMYDLQVGIHKEPTAQSVLVYPNPFTDEIFLKIPSPVKAVVYSATGSIVYDSIELSANSILDLSKLTSGLYILSVTDDKGRVYKSKLLKK